MKKYVVIAAHWYCLDLRKTFKSGEVIEEKLLSDASVEIAKAVKDGWIEEYIPHKLTKANITAHPYHVAQMGWKEGDTVHAKTKNFNPKSTVEPKSWALDKNKTEFEPRYAEIEEETKA